MVRKSQQGHRHSVPASVSKLIRGLNAKATPNKRHVHKLGCLDTCSDARLNVRVKKDWYVVRGPAGTGDYRGMVHALAEMDKAAVHHGAPFKPNKRAVINVDHEDCAGAKQVISIAMQQMASTGKLGKGPPAKVQKFGVQFVGELWKPLRKLVAAGEIKLPTKPISNKAERDRIIRRSADKLALSNAIYSSHQFNSDVRRHGDRYLRQFEAIPLFQKQDKTTGQFVTKRIDPRTIKRHLRVMGYRTDLKGRPLPPVSK